LQPGDVLEGAAIATANTAAGDPAISFWLNVKITADSGQFTAANGTASVTVGPGADSEVFSERVGYTVPSGYYSYYDVMASLYYFDDATSTFVDLASLWGYFYTD
jgi:hypothetical protein